MSYPKGWTKISADVKKAAGYRCEWCRWRGHQGSKSNGMVTAHLDQNQSNCATSNLACLCRLCHNHYDSYGVSPLLPKLEIDGRISILSKKASKVMRVLQGLAGQYPKTDLFDGPLEWAWEVAAVADDLKLILNILDHYKRLKSYRPVRKTEVIVPATWKGYMDLFGNQG